MPRCLFASDLHGHIDRYETLVAEVRARTPAAVFLGGDLLPHGLRTVGTAEAEYADFLGDYLAPRLRALRADLGGAYPRVFVILGNDDPRSEEPTVQALADEGLWEYIHGRRATLAGWDVFGYACVPPTPFLLKDWERYDVSRYVDPGCVAPEDGRRTAPTPESELRYATIADDLARLTGDGPLDRAILLLHTPPYRTALDRAALDGRVIDHVPVDVHVGSIAVRRLIETRRPALVLCGHIHEAPRLTGTWRDRVGDTPCLTAAHDGPELALVEFDPADPAAATRALR